MRNNRIVLACTLLGLLTGIIIAWFVSVQSGTTWQHWINDLFLSPTWEGWLVFTVTILLPVLVGLRTGLVRDNFSGILLTPVFSLLSSAAGLLLVGFTLMIMMNFAVYSFLGFVAIIGLLLPTTCSILIIIAN